MQGKDKEGEEVQGGVGGGLQGWPQPFPGIGELEPPLNFSITPLQAAKNMSNRGEKFERGREEGKSWGGGYRGEGDQKYSGGDRRWSRGVVREKVEEEGVTEMEVITITPRMVTITIRVNITGVK